MQHAAQTLQFLFWFVEAAVLGLVLFPICRFLLYGWKIRKNEFTNRLAGPQLQDYIDRFWKKTFEIDHKRPNLSNEDKFAYAYGLVAGRGGYVILTAILLVVVFIFSGMVISTGLRAAYDRYLDYYFQCRSEAAGACVGNLTRLPFADEDHALIPFAHVVLTSSSIAAVAGAYLYSVDAILTGYRQRTLLGSDLLWCSFRLIISIPLGMVVSGSAPAGLQPFIAFALGAFPISEIKKMLRRIANASLAQREPDDADQLVKLLGVSPDSAAALNGEGISSVQQLSNLDPVSLALRTGLSFDYVLNLVAQSQAWCFIGETAGALSPFGFGNARAIAKLIRAIDGNDADAAATIAALAGKAGVDPAVLRVSFRNIAADPYTAFLENVSSGR